MKAKPSLSLWSNLIAALLVSLSSKALAESNLSGESLFLENCAECHQANGQGIKNIYPALAGNELTNGNGLDVALVLIIGRGEMPSFAGAIANADLAKIVNYVVSAWGNSGNPISEVKVTEIQNE